MSFSNQSLTMRAYYKIYNGETRLFVKFAYDLKKIELVKTIEGRQYSRSETSWHFRIDRSSWYQLIEIFPELRQLIRPRFHALLKEEVGPVDPGELIDYDKWKTKQRKIAKKEYDKRLNGWQKQAVSDLEEKLVLRRLSSNTVKSYVSALTMFLLYTEKSSMEEVTKKEVEDFLRYMYNERNISESYMNVIINAVKAYYEKVLGWPKMRFDIARPKRPFKVIQPFSKQEIERFFSVIENLKHKTLLMLVYSSGLRISEVCKIRRQDIKWDHNLVYIKEAKGKRDRYSVLAESMKQVLRLYIDQYKPRYYLFEGAKPKTPYSRSSVNKVFHRAKNKAKVNPEATVHTLRHTFATHSMENGMPLHTIQKLLGHRDIKTTARYLYVTSESLKKAQSPLDKLNIFDADEEE